LVRHLLESGYLEEWRFNPTLSGCPQGGVISPILSNIYLNKLDQYVEHVLIPQYTRGEKRAANPPYTTLRTQEQRMRRRGKREEAKALHKQRQKLSSIDPNDQTYRRLYYVRYADDTLFGFAGPRSEAEEIKEQLGQFLQETLKLELSQEKTLITHASTEKARFLNYHIVNQQCDTKQTRKRRTANGRIGLLVPPDVVESKCALYQQAGKPHHRPQLLENDDFTIINQYQQEYRGVVQYYLLAHNVSWFGKLYWVAKCSLLKTLAYKHRSSMKAQWRKYQASFQAANGMLYKCLEIQVQREGKKPLVARFGGIPLRRASNGKTRRSKPKCRSIRTQRTAQTAPSRCMRTLWIKEQRGSAPYSQACRSRKRGKRKTMLGQNHGCPPKKDPHGLPLLSPGHPCWTAYATESIGLNDWRAVCSETGTYSSVGGRWNRAKKAPRQRPTRHRFE
jgi:hypothetical protein